MDAIKTFFHCLPCLQPEGEEAACPQKNEATKQTVHPNNKVAEPRATGRPRSQAFYNLPQPDLGVLTMDERKLLDHPHGAADYTLDSSTFISRPSATAMGQFMSKEYLTGEAFYKDPEDWNDDPVAAREARRRDRYDYDCFLTNMANAVPRPEASGPKRRPPPPTPITLPVYTVVPFGRRQAESIDLPKLNALFVQTAVPRWGVEHHKALGVELVNGTYIEDLVPTSYIPPKAWEERPAPEQSELSGYDTSAPSTETLSNGGAIPGHEAFYGRVTELKHDRVSVLNAIARRKPPPGQKPIKVTHYRRFWHAIDNVSCYWDTSKDDFRPPGASEPMVVDDIPSVASHKQTSLQPSPVNPGTQQQNANVAIGASSTSTTEAVAAKDYYGLRTGDGRSMQNMHRADLVCNLIEPIIQSMACFYEARAGPPVPSTSRAVRIQNGLIRLDITGLVYRGPKDRLMARQGWNEGPILAVSARSPVDFTQPVSISDAMKNDAWAERLKASNVDLLAQLQNPATRATAKRHLVELGFYVTDDKEPKILRWSGLDIIDFSQELGALLMMAQMRARNAKSDTEVRLGTGQWWAEAPRFGGHENQGEATGQPLFKDDMTPVEEQQPANEMAVDDEAERTPRTEARGPIDPEAAMIAVSPSRIADNAPRRRGKAKKESREVMQMRARRALSWKIPRPLYDPRTIYIPVGMGAEQEFDHVYLVSSLFHHISILRLRIHPAMLAYMSADKDSNTTKPPLQHYGLHVSRTRWFDLLNADDRVEAMRGVWGVMAYMMRDTTTEHPENRAFARRLSRAGILAEAARSQ